MRVRELVPGTGAEFEVPGDEGRAWLTEVYSPADADQVRLNMITSLTGSAVGADGTSGTLASRVDRAILGVIRAHADVVVAGAGTVRTEGYVLPRRSRLAVVTTTGDLSGHRFADADAEVLLVAPADRVEAVRERARLPRAEVVPVAGGSGPLDARRIVGALRERGMRRIVCEGGPALAGAFAASDVVDEYCVSVAPVLEPAREPFLPLPDGVRPETRVAGMLADDAGFTYLRLRRA